jgi:serine/threonine-protein kinase
MTYGSATCALCGYSVATGEVADDRVPGALEDNVRRELGNQYKIERLLGRGGMSLVYLARELELSRHVALKVLPLQLVLGVDAVDRFKREAKVSASLDHPHIVPVVRVGSTPTFLWYSMRWVKGGSLRELLDRIGPMSLADALKVLEPVASALHYAHQRGVVHRDVKPANVMIDETGWVAICDFGIAKLFGAMPLTHTGATLGTPGYMPPEQCYGKSLDGRADQYSFAILTYECLAGRLPFTADSLGEIVRKHCMEPPPSLSDVRPDIPEKVTLALAKAMSKRPDDRFTDVLEFVRAIGGTIAAGAPGVATTAASLPQLSSARTQRLWSVRRLPLKWIVPMAALAGLSAFLALRNSSPTGTVASPAPAIEASAAPAVQPGYLWVSSTPWGYLYLDDRNVGATPQPRVELTPGRHQLRIVREGYEPYEQSIEIASGQEVRVTNVQLKRTPS